MESTEKIVSREDEDFPEDVDKVLNAIPKCTYPTVDQLIKETGLKSKRLGKALKHLEKSKLIRQRIDPFYGVLYKVAPLSTTVTEKKTRVKRDSLEKAEEMARVKPLYEAKKKYRDIAKELGIPEHKVAHLCALLIELGQVKRRNAVNLNADPKPPPAILVEQDDHEDDQEPEVHEQAAPDIADVLKTFERGANEIKRMGWQIELQIHLTWDGKSFPIVLKGAS